MDRSKYDAITGTCLLVMIVGALAFDRFPTLHVVAGSIVALSGLLSAGAYFVNLARSKQQPQARCGESAAELVEKAPTESTPDLVLFCDDVGTFAIGEVKKQAVPVEYTRALYLAALPMFAPRRTFPEEVVEIVTRLAYSSHSAAEFEFEFTRGGTLRIIAKGKPSGFVRPSEPEAFESPYRVMAATQKPD